ncbi:MAG: glycosyltransferase, partial [Sphingobacteriaceae bacterium]
MITPGHLASNPRLVKEAQALTAAGYQVHLIFTQYVCYLIDFDSVILKKNPAWTFDCLNRTTKSIGTQSRNYAAAAIQKLCLMLLLQGKNSDYVLSHAINRFFGWQCKKAAATKADLYIAHNLAALPVAVFAAKKNNSKCGFDAEDFHRNEVSDDPENEDVILKTSIENQYIPQISYLTSSSLQITNLYHALFPAKKIDTIRNVFPAVKTAQLPFTQTDQPLKLFWFSQSIGLNRGLQDVLAAIKLLENEAVELHLLGFLTDETSKNLLRIIADLKFKRKPAILFHQPVYADQLINFAAQFDIGLALEPAFCLNNDAALSNKIFTYLQAGLAVLATDTTAQKQFLAENPALGFCYEKGNPAQLAAILKQLIDDPALLQKTRQKA